MGSRRAGSRRLLLLQWELRAALCRRCCIRPLSPAHPLSPMEQLPQTHPEPLHSCQGIEISTMIQQKKTPNPQTNLLWKGINLSKWGHLPPRSCLPKDAEVQGNTEFEWVSANPSRLNSEPCHFHPCLVLMPLCK